ncbi:MAG TPA: hypothetical protein VFR03_05795 [Thermoanaerobaculia bacterium]|nr:hypothetical protein [Thermoanaerobaculia bacterium]
MNFENVLGVVSSFLEEKEVNFAVIGGVDPAWGNLDFVYVGAETSREIFAACRIVTGPGGRLIRVPKPEHMAALKVNAMKNDPARTFQDMADVQFLLTLPGIDRGQVRDYFDRQGMRDRFDELEKT